MQIPQVCQEMSLELWDRDTCSHTGLCLSTRRKPKVETEQGTEYQTAKRTYWEVGLGRRKTFKVWSYF